MLTPAERTELLAIARAAITWRVTTRSRPGQPDSSIARPGGAFVTIRRGGELRGCIGSIADDEPLVTVVARCAAAAAEDPRFRPIRSDELAELTLEISVLGPLWRVKEVADIVIGRHGLMVEHDGRHGLLLPQVAEEHGWDPETFLASTSIKAGLHADAWKSATVYGFEADVFGDVED